MPDWKKEILKRLPRQGLGPERELEVVEELAQHLDDRYEELRAGGAAEEEARRAALEELGGGENLAEELRKVGRPAAPEPTVLGARRRNMLADLWQDLRYGGRMLWKNRGF
ncbi:MAG: permease prefix domain 1-containing protein, partial [Pyrinomonadaceae bacterium]